MRKEPTIEALVCCDAARLFIDHGRSRLPAFELTERKAGAAARMCRKLEGIPLAIELATARMEALAVERIARRLEASLKLLTGGSRTALAVVALESMVVALAAGAGPAQAAFPGPTAG